MKAAESKPVHQSQAYYTRITGRLKGATYKYNWKMMRVDTKKEIEVKHPPKQLNVLIFEPYSLPRGMYEIYVNVRAFKDPEGTFIKAAHIKCFLMISSSTPQAIISSGSSRTVPSLKEIQIDGSQSMLMDKKTTEPLQFIWTCTQKSSNQKYCKKGSSVISTAKRFVIPAKFAISKEVFNILLTVKTSDEASSKTSQTVMVEDNAAVVSISCQKNCPPAAPCTISKNSILLYANCQSNCVGVKDGDYEWSLTKLPKFDFEKNTVFGKTGRKFNSKPNVFIPGDYEIQVKLKAPLVGYAMNRVRVEKHIAPKRCHIEPKSGMSLQTPFQLKCSHIPEWNYYFELYNKQLSPGGLLFAASVHDLDNETFVLPTGDQFTLKISKFTGVNLMETLNVHVTSSMNKNDPNSVKDAIEDIYGGVNSSFGDGHRQEALQKLEGLVLELVDVPDDNPEVARIINQLKHSVVADMIGTTTDSLEEVSQMMNAVGTLVGIQDNKTDPVMARLTSVFCKKMAEKQVEMMKNQVYPTTLADDAQSVFKSLSQCTLANTEPNPDILQPESDLNMTSTNVPFITDPGAITENYPNYQDFDNKYYDNLDNLAEATSNIFKTSALSAKSLAMATAIGEKFVEQEGPKKFHKMIVAKDLGVVLVKSTLEAHGVSVRPSMDLDQEHPFDILLSVWQKDLMWWNSEKIRVMTDILHLEFWHSTCKDQMTHFMSPTSISMKVQDEFVDDLLHDQRSIHENYELGSSGRDRLSSTKEIRTRRINLTQKQTVLIHFSNISTILDVVIVTMKQPTIEDFDGKFQIGLEDATLPYTNTAKEDVWIYVGVLTAGIGPEVDEISYTLHVISPQCISWTSSKSSWITSNCTIGDGTTITMIECECSDLELPTMGGIMRSLETTLQEVLEVNFQLELQITFNVFGWVTICTFFFVLLLVFLLRKRPEEIYYLADNDREDRYAYLIVVKTENVRNGGTSSNVTIRLIGDKGKSDAHVLNYPDPERRILQMNCEDWFILTTRSHLGEIVEIDLWHDSIGTTPSWYCRHVLVYDMQKKNERMFKVDTNFNASKDVTRVNVQSDYCHVDRKIPLWRKFKVWDEYHRWYLGRTHDNLLYIERISLIYSTFLLTGAVSLILFGLPTMTLLDCFDSSIYFELKWEIAIVVAISSIVSFVPHSILAWTFRSSRKQFPKFDDVTRFNHKVTLMCWIVVICLILIGATFLLVFGWWLPTILSLLWLTTCAIAVVLQVFVYENLLVLATNFLVKTNLKNHIDEKFACIVGMIEQQRTTLYDSFGSFLLRPYFQHLYSPLGIDKLKESKSREIDRRNVIDQIQDLVMFSIYILILFMVIVMQKDEFAVISNQEMTDMVEGVHSRTKSFSDITSRHDMFEYLYHTLIPTMQSSLWYGRWNTIDPGLMKDVSNKYLGVARLRQQRTLPIQCDIAEVMKFVNTTCEPEVSFWITETHPFSRGWQKPNPSMKRQRLYRMWKYSKTKKTGSSMVIGMVSTYSGGGYVMPLGRTLYNSYANLRISTKYSWIDNRTMGTFIEFLTYNVNYNMFNAVELLVEHSSAGYTHTTITIATARMLYVQNETEHLTSATFCLFVFWVGFLMLRKSVGLVKHFRTAYKDVWLIIDMVILLMSIVCIGMVVLRVRMIGNFMSALERAKHNKFVNYFALFHLEDSLTVFSAILVCVATIRLWRFLRFILAFRIMERTLILAGPPLLHTLISHMFLLVGFTFSGLVLYGTDVIGFESIWDTLTTIMQLSFNLFKSFHFAAFIEHSFSWAYFLTMSVVMYIFLSLYITNILLAHARAKLDFSEGIVKYSIKDYAQEKIEELPIWLRIKLKHLKAGGGTLSVWPKDDEFRYSESVQTSQFNMKMMEYLVQALINDQNGRDRARSEKIMTNISKLYLDKNNLEEEKEFFYRGHPPGHRISLIDERRIQKMEQAVTFLLDSKPTSPRVKMERKLTKTDECNRIIKQNLISLRTCEIKLRLILAKLQDVSF